MWRGERAKETQFELYLEEIIIQKGEAKYKIFKKRYGGMRNVELLENYVIGLDYDLSMF